MSKTSRRKRRWRRCPYCKARVNPRHRQHVKTCRALEKIRRSAASKPKMAYEESILKGAYEVFLLVEGKKVMLNDS